MGTIRLGCVMVLVAQTVFAVIVSMRAVCADAPNPVNAIEMG